MSKEIIEDLEKLQTRADELDVRKENNLMREITLDLKDWLREHEGYAGISANQLGYSKRVFCINFNGDIRTFINPVISSAKGLTLNREKCASIKDKEYIRPRNTEITLMYQTPLGKVETRKIFGLAACLVQQQVDLLDGITLADIGLEIDKDFDEASEEERNKIIDMYLDSLDIRTKEMNKLLETDPELKQTNDAIKFMEQLQKGEIQLGESVTETKKAESKEEKEEEIKEGE